MIIFDSADYGPADRAEAHRAFLNTRSSPCEVVHDLPGERIRLRQELARYGPVTHVTTRGTGFRLVRSDLHIRRTTQNTLSIGTQPGGTGRYAWKDHVQDVGRTGLLIADRTEGHTYSWDDPDGCVYTFLLDTDHLALPEATVRAAIPRVALSPLAPLVNHQLHALGDGRDRLTGGLSGHSLGHAVVELVRALIMSVTDDDAARRDAADRSLLDRVLAYTDLHAADPALTPQRVAAAHHVSLRTLYRLLGRAGISLEQELIAYRLRTARRALENPANAHRTIAAVAAAQGFTDMTFFARRFRRAYGRSPTEHRREALSLAGLAAGPKAAEEG